MNRAGITFTNLNVSRFRSFGRLAVVSAIFMLIALASAMALSQPARANEVYDTHLICELTKYGNANVTPKFAKGWLQHIQRHIIYRSKGAIHSYWTSHWKPMQGTVTIDTPKKVTWNYKYDEEVTGQTYRVNFKFNWFPHNGKFAAAVDYTGYQGIENVWGTCSEKKEYANSKTLMQSLSEMNA